MPLISRTTARKRYHKLTGRNLAASTQVVLGLPTVPDGKRLKINDRVLGKAIQVEIEKQEKPIEIDIRPLSDRQRARIQESV